MSPARLVRRTTIALSAMVALLTASAYLGWRGGESERTAARLVEHTHAVLDNVTELRSAVTASQGNLNAYLVTLDSGALDEFRRNTQDANARLGRLNALAGTDAPESEGIHRATAGLAALTSARDGILAARRMSLDAARTAFATTDVATHRHALLSVLDSLERTERGLLVTRSTARERAKTLSISALIASLLTALGLGLWTVNATRLQIRTVQTSSARHRELAEQNPDGMLVRIGERIVYANTAAAVLLGYESGADLVGRPLVELLHPDFREASLARFRSPDPEGLTLQTSRRQLVRVDGSIVEAEVRAVQIMFDGQPASEIVVRDLTARLAVEEAHKLSEARYRALLDAMMEGVVLQGPELQMLLWNPAAERILGLTGEQLAGRGTFDPRWRVIDEDGQTLAGEHHPAAVAMRSGAMASRVVGVERPNGELVWMQATSVPLVADAASTPYAVETTFADITASRLAAAQITDSERRYRLLADNSADLITRRSPDHVLEYVSPSHEAVLGWTPDEMLGRNIGDFIVPDGSVDIPTLLGQPGVLHTAARVRHKAGHSLWLDVTSKSLHDTNGLVTGYQTSSRDVTDRRALEERLRHAEKMDALGRMATGVAHDFNNLLTVIRSSSDLLRGRGTADRDSAGILDDISLAAERAAGLTAQLLTFARRQHREPERLNVMTLLRRTYPLLSRLAGTDVAVELTCSAAGSTALIEAEAAQIDQVVYNLVVNARDAMPHGGAVRIECDATVLDARQTSRHGALEAGRYVTLRVTDSGTGMTEEVLTKLFDPFFTTKPQGKGTGLGLGTVLGIVQQAHGAVVVESTVGQGSAFTIYWPQVIPHSTSAPTPLTQTSIYTSDTPSGLGATPEVPRPDVAGNATRVLVVDDEDVVRKVVALVLQRAGYDVVLADGGAPALALLRAPDHGVRAVVTDVRMPGMSGIELVTAMQDEQIALPVLFMSGQLDVALPEDWPTTLPRLFVGKPFATSELVLRVQELLAAVRTAP